MPPIDQPTKTIELKMVGRAVTVDQLKDKLKRIDDASKKAIFDTLDRLYEKSSETKVLESLEQFAAALAGSDVIENTRAASSDGVDLDFLLGINSFDIRALFQICKVDPSSPTSEDEFKAKLAEFLEIPNYEVTTPLPAASAGETPESEASLEVKSVEDRVEALQERLGQKPDPKFIRLQQGVIRAISENFQEGKFIVQGLATELEMEMILEVLSSRFPEKFKTFGVMKDGFGYRLFCGQDGLPENYTQILPISRELERLSEVAESRSAVDTAYANMRDKQLGNKAAGGSRAWSIARFAAGYVKNLTIGFIPVVGYALSSYASLRAKMEEVGTYKGMIPTDSSFEWQAAVTRRRGVDGVFRLVCHDLSGDESDLKGYAFWARQYELMSRGFSYNQAVIVSVEQVLPKVNSFPVAKALMALISDPQTYTDIQGSWALKGINLPDLSEIFDEANPRLLQPAGIEKLITAIHSLCLNIDQSQSLGLHRLLGVDVVSALSKVAQPTELDQSYLLKIQSRGSILGIIGIDGSKRLNKNTSLQAVLGGVSAVMGLTSTFAQAFKGSEYLLSGALEAMTRPAGTLANTWRRVVIARETRQMKHDAVTADSILGEILSTASMMSLGVVSYAIGTQLAGHQLADLMRNGGAANGLDKFLSGTGIKFFVRAAMALSVGAFGAAREVRRGGSYQSSMEAAIRYGMGTWAGSSLYSAYDALGAFATNNGQMSMWQIAHDTLEDMKKAASGVPDISSKLPEVPQDVDGINTPVSQIRYNKAGYTDTFSAAGFDEESAFANADESNTVTGEINLQGQGNIPSPMDELIITENGGSQSLEDIAEGLMPGATVAFEQGGVEVTYIVKPGDTVSSILSTNDEGVMAAFVKNNLQAFSLTESQGLPSIEPIPPQGSLIPNGTNNVPQQEAPQAPSVVQPLNQQPAPQGAPVQPQVRYNFPSSSVDTTNWKDDNAAALAARASTVASLAVAAGGQSNPAGLRSDILAGLSQEELAKIAGLTQQQIEAAGSVEGALKELGLSSSEAYQVSVIFTEGATVEKILRNSPTLVSVAPGSQALPQTIPNQPTVVTQPQATQTAPITVGPFASDNIPAETPISANQQQTLQVDPTYSGHLSALDQWVNEAGNGSGGQERSSIAAYVRAILAVLDADGNGTIVDDQTLNNFRRVFDINGMIKQSDIVEIATALYIANDLDPKLNNLNISSFTSNPEAFKDLLINAHTSRPDLLALYVDDFVSKYKGAEEGIVTGMEIQNGQTPQGWAGSTEGGFSGNTSPFPPGSEILNIQSVVITEVLRNDELNTPLRLNGPTDLNASITYNRIPGQNAYSVIVPPDSRFLTFGRAFQGLPFAAQAWGYRAFEGNFETVTYLYVKPDDSSLGYIFDQNRQLIGIYNSEDGKTYWSSAGVTNEMELDLGGGRFVKMSVITSSTSEEIKAILSGQNPSTPVATETTDTSIPEPDANPQFGGTPNQQPSPISIPETAPGPTPPESGTPEFTAEATAGASIINLFERGRTDVVHISPSEYQSISGADWQTILEGISPDKDILFIGSNLQVYSTNVGENTIPHLNVSGDNLATLNEVMHSGPIGASSTPVSVSLDAELSTSAEAYEAILDYSYNGGNGVREVILTINGSEKGDMVAFRISNNGNEVTVSELGNSQAIYKIADLDGNSVWEIQKQVEKDYKMTEELLTGISLGLGNSFTSYAMDMSSINDMILFTTQASSYDGVVRLRYGSESDADFDGYVELQNGTAEILNSGLVSQPGYVVLGKDFLGIVEGSRDNWQNARFYDMNGRYFPANPTGGYLFAEDANELYLVQRSNSGETLNIWRIKFDGTGEGFCVLEKVDDLSMEFEREQTFLPTSESTVEAAAEVVPEVTDEPTEAPTATTTPSYTPTLSPTPEPSNTPTPTSTTEPTATVTSTDIPTDVPTETSTSTLEPTNVSTASSTPTEIENLTYIQVPGFSYRHGDTNELVFVTSDNRAWVERDDEMVEVGFYIEFDSDSVVGNVSASLLFVHEFVEGVESYKAVGSNGNVYGSTEKLDGKIVHTPQNPSGINYNVRYVIDGGSITSEVTIGSKVYTFEGVIRYATEAKIDPNGINGAPTIIAGRVYEVGEDDKLTLLPSVTIVNSNIESGKVIYEDSQGYFINQGEYLERTQYLGADLANNNLLFYVIGETVLTGTGYMVSDENVKILNDNERVVIWDDRYFKLEKDTQTITELTQADYSVLLSSGVVTPETTPESIEAPNSTPTPVPPTSTTEPTATVIPTDIPTDEPTETLVPTDRPTNTTTATNTPTATLTSTPSPTSTPGGFLIPDFSVAGFDKITTLAGLTASFTPAANALEALFGDDYDATAYINEFIEGKCFTGEKAIGILDARSSINEQSNLRSNGTTPIVLVDGKYQVGALLFRESRPDHGLVNEELVQAAIYNILLDNVTDNPNIYSSIGITGINATINSLGGYPEGEGRLRTVAEAMQLALIYEANKDTGYRPRSNYDFQTFGATTPDENFDEYEEANSVVTQWKINVLSLLTIEQRGSLGMSLQSSNIEFIKLLLDPQKYEDLENYLFTLGSFKGDTIHAFELISMSRGNEGGTDDTTLGISPDQFADAQAKADELGATPTPTPSSTATPTSTFTLTSSYTPTNTPTLTYTPTSTPSNTPTPTSTPSNTPTNTPTLTPTLTPTPSATNTFTATPSSTPTSTGTFTPTPSPTHTPSPTSTERPTNTPTSTLPPSDTPTDLPTVTPEETIIAGQEVESRRWQAEGLFWEFDGNRLRYADGIEVWQEHWRKADNTEFLVRLGDKYYHLLPGGRIDEVNETEFELMKKEMVLVSETIDPVMLGLAGTCSIAILLVGSLLGIGIFGRKVLKNMIKGAGDPSEEEKVIDEMLSAGVGGLTLAMSLSSMIQAYPDKTPHEILYFIKQKDPTGYTRLFENFNEQELAKIMGSLLTRTRDLLTQAGKEPSIPDELKDLVFEGGIVRRDAGAISLSFGSEFGGGKTYTISNTKDAPEYCLVIGGLVCWGLLRLNIVVDSEIRKVNHADFAYNRGSFKVDDLTVENLGSLLVNEDGSLSFSGESIRVTKGDVVYSFVKDVVIEGSKVVLKKRDGSPDVELAL